ncbi:MAG: hypothetical protein ACKOCN_11165 [Planctomycetaceae bacterium]
MFTRTCLLASCMIVVPLLAMFSHKVPRSIREAIRESMASVIGRSGVESPGGAPSSSSDRASEPSEPVVDNDRRLGTAVAGIMYPDPHPAGEPSGSVVPQSSPAETDEDERMLTALGAVEIECHRSVRPLPQGRMGTDGSIGLHVASCRLPVDPSGQLVRIFHAQADTPEVALNRLRLEVQAWKARVAASSGNSLE